MPKKLKYDKILDALQKLLETKELSNISVSEIAQTAEIGKGSIYYYFSSKDAILEALVERNYEVPITTASRIAGHADERTTIKNYLFDTNNEEETKKAILNALGDNPESSVTTTYRNVENKNVTKRDSNIILFPSNKKAENPCFKRIFH